MKHFARTEVNDIVFLTKDGNGKDMNYGWYELKLKWLSLLFHLQTIWLMTNNFKWLWLIDWLIYWIIYCSFTSVWWYSEQEGDIRQCTPCSLTNRPQKTRCTWRNITVGKYNWTQITTECVNVRSCFIFCLFFCVFCVYVCFVCLLVLFLLFCLIFIEIHICLNM